MSMIAEDTLMCDREWGDTEFESKILRNLLGCYPTGVAIVTTRTADGRDVGLTINSFASLSLDPPLVTFSLLLVTSMLIKRRAQKSALKLKGSALSSLMVQAYYLRQLSVVIFSTIQSQRQEPHHCLNGLPIGITQQ